MSLKLDVIRSWAVIYRSHYGARRRTRSRRFAWASDVLSVFYSVSLSTRIACGTGRFLTATSHAGHTGLRPCQQRCRHTSNSTRRHGSARLRTGRKHGSINRATAFNKRQVATRLPSLLPCIPNTLLDLDLETSMNHVRRTN